MGESTERGDVQNPFAKLPREDVERFFERLGRSLLDGWTAPDVPGLWSFLETLGVTEGVLLLASHFASEYNMRPNEVFLKSLALFKLAHDALEAGNRVAILDSEDVIVQEVTGIDTPWPAAQEAS